MSASGSICSTYIPDPQDPTNTLPVLVEFRAWNEKYFDDRKGHPEGGFSHRTRVELERVTRINGGGEIAVRKLFIETQEQLIEDCLKAISPSTNKQQN